MQSIIEREIGQMNGRSDKVFVAGLGVGGQLAMLAAFHSQHLLGGSFCLDAEIPERIVQAVQSNEGAAVFPQYEAKKNMFICVTKYKASLDEMKIQQ